MIYTYIVKEGEEGETPQSELKTELGDKPGDIELNRAKQVLTALQEEFEEEEEVEEEVEKDDEDEKDES